MAAPVPARAGWSVYPKFRRYPWSATHSGEAVEIVILRFENPVLNQNVRLTTPAVPIPALPPLLQEGIMASLLFFAVQV